MGTRHFNISEAGYEINEYAYTVTWLLRIFNMPSAVMVPPCLYLKYTAETLLSNTTPIIGIYRQ